MLPSSVGLLLEARGLCAGNAGHSWGMPGSGASWRYQKVRGEEQCSQKVSNRGRRWLLADFAVQASSCLGKELPGSAPVH